MASSMTPDNIEYLPLAIFTEKSYLDYSMAVILDRALPHIGDGFKPVQRRITYAMSELGLKATAKFKKSARTVGDVLGKFHPHGDGACYEAMVLMAQGFSYRYPIISGQGNWGSPDDPKSFAAMRYTESRLSAYADSFLSELGQGTVDWIPNFDGTLDEPAVLPARLPNVLLNPTTGIAVGMATDIPPHNLREVTAACIHLLDNPKATVDDLRQFITAPDYPTGAEIISSQTELQELYESGKGGLRLRAVYHIEDGNIVLTALPYQVSGSKILEQVAAQMQAKKLPMVADLHDESDHENPTRLVIEPRSNRVDKDALMDHLFATTDLEKTYRANFNVIGLNGRPQVKNLRTLLKEWLEFRMQTVTKRLQFRLEKIIDRLHILDGLLIAFLNIDEVIHIIRTEDDPKAELIKRFQLTAIQADAILDLKLRQLAKLEEIKIRTEQNELSDERDRIAKILDSKARLKTLIKQELQQDADAFGDDRRSALVERREARAMKESDMLPAEAITVILSEKAWIKAAKGHDIDVEKLNFKSGDGFLMKAMGKSNEQALFLDSTGRSYSILAQQLPSARGYGEPLTGRLNPPAGSQFVGVLMGQTEQCCLLSSDAGYGFICPLNELHSKNKNGKAIIKAPQASLVLPPRLIKDLEHDLIISVTTEGRMLVFPVKELPQLNRGKGNKIINIPSKNVANRSEYVVDIAVLHDQQKLILHSGKRYLKLSIKDLIHYQGERGRRGLKLPRGFQRVDRIETEN